MSLIEVGTSETGTTVLLIPVNEQTYLVVSEDGCEQDAPYPTLQSAQKAFEAKMARS